jgi:hypothetical protein
MQKEGGLLGPLLFALLKDGSNPRLEGGSTSLPGANLDRRRRAAKRGAPRDGGEQSLSLRQFIKKGPLLRGPFFLGHSSRAVGFELEMYRPVRQNRRGPAHAPDGRQGGRPGFPRSRMRSGKGRTIPLACWLVSNLFACLFPSKSFVFPAQQGSCQSIYIITTTSIVLLK